MAWTQSIDESTMLYTLICDIHSIIAAIRIETHACMNKILSVKI